MTSQALGLEIGCFSSLSGGWDGMDKRINGSEQEAKEKTCHGPLLSSVHPRGHPLPSLPSSLA